MILNKKKKPFESYKVTFVDTVANSIHFDTLNAEREVVNSSVKVINRKKTNFYKKAKNKNIETVAYDELKKTVGNNWELEDDQQNWPTIDDVPATKLVQIIIPDEVFGDAALDDNGMSAFLNRTIAASKVDPVIDTTPFIIKVRRSKKDIVTIIYLNELFESNRLAFRRENSEGVESFDIGYLQKEIFSDGSETIYNENGNVVINHKKA